MRRKKGIRKYKKKVVKDVEKIGHKRKDPNEGETETETERHQKLLFLGNKDLVILTRINSK